MTTIQKTIAGLIANKIKLEFLEGGNRVDCLDLVMKFVFHKDINEPVLSDSMVMGKQLVDLIDEEAYNQITGSVERLVQCDTYIELMENLGDINLLTDSVFSFCQNLVVTTLLRKYKKDMYRNVYFVFSVETYQVDEEDEEKVISKNVFIECIVELTN